MTATLVIVATGVVYTPRYHDGAYTVDLQVDGYEKAHWAALSVGGDIAIIVDGVERCVVGVDGFVKG